MIGHEAGVRRGLHRNLSVPKVRAQDKVVRALVRPREKLAAELEGGRSGRGPALHSRQGVRPFAHVSEPGVAMRARDGPGLPRWGRTCARPARRDISSAEKVERPSVAANGEASQDSFGLTGALDRKAPGDDEQDRRDTEIRQEDEPVTHWSAAPVHDDVNKAKRHLHRSGSKRVCSRSECQEPHEGIGQCPLALPRGHLVPRMSGRQP